MATVRVMPMRPWMPEKVTKVPQGVLTSSVGEFGYARQFDTTSWRFMGGGILGAAEATISNGPWVVPK